ncbi:MAG: glycosyltransferase [Candidatus Hadarchaeaceae archaeon]
MASYVLLTAARNEEKYIQNLIRSVARQTITPIRWIIVDDGSTDGTFATAMKAAKDLQAVQIITRQGQEHGFASKAASLNHGWEVLKGQFTNSPPNFIGVVDADINFPPEHFERLMNLMTDDEKLGLAGGWVLEPKDGTWQPRSLNQKHSVPGCSQFFRWSAFEKIGGFLLSPFGGEDWAAEICIRAHGFDVRSFPELPVFHHRPAVKDWRSGLRTAFRQGRMDASLGCGLLFHLARTVRRSRQKPALISAAARFAGYAWQRCTGRCILPPEPLEYFRKWQVKRLKAFIQSKSQIS